MFEEVAQRQNFFDSEKHYWSQDDGADLATADFGALAKYRTRIEASASAPATATSEARLYCQTNTHKLHKLLFVLEDSMCQGPAAKNKLPEVYRQHSGQVSKDSSPGCRFEAKL